jgi:hypothetical protein
MSAPAGKKFEKARKKRSRKTYVLKTKKARKKKSSRKKIVISV